MEETYYQSHREDLLQRAKSRYYSKKEECLEYQKQYSQRNNDVRKKWEKEDRRKNPKKYHDRQLAKKYGITYDYLRELYVSHDGRCAICKEKFQNRKSMTVDHDHTTKTIRGLLCHRCNRGLGQFRDNSTLLFTAAEYVLEQGHKL